MTAHKTKRERETPIRPGSHRVRSDPHRRRAPRAREERIAGGRRRRRRGPGRFHDRARSAHGTLQRATRNETARGAPESVRPGRAGTVPRDGARAAHQRDNARNRRGTARGHQLGGGRGESANPVISSFIPDVAYVERLAARADEALACVEGVWRDGTPVDLRDRAGLFYTARHVAYCARTTVPEDEEMALYRVLVSGLADRYEVPGWRARRTLDRIEQWVRNPEHAQYVEKRAQVATWHPNCVLRCARHEVRLAASEVLNGRGHTHAEIAARLGCSDRHVRRLLAEAGAARKLRPRWDTEEIELLRYAVTGRGTDSERQACANIARKLGRRPETVHAQWKRLKGKGLDGEAQARPARARNQQ